MVYKIFDKRSSGSIIFAMCVNKFAGNGVKSEVMPKQELAEELQKPIIRKFEKWKVYWSFIESIWDADLADMWLISKFNKRFRFLLCVNDVYSNNAWFVPLKDK